MLKLGCIRLLLLTFLIIPFFSNGQEPCYSFYKESRLKGFLGKLNGQNLYYEVWEKGGVAGTNYSAILLRNDTLDISDSIEFCLDWDRQLDSIYVQITRQDTTISYTTKDEKTIPTLFQALSISYGYEYNQSLTLKNNRIFLKYFEHPNLDEYYRITTAVFELRNDRFKFIKSHTIKKKAAVEY